MGRNSHFWSTDPFTKGKGEATKISISSFSLNCPFCLLVLIYLMASLEIFSCLSTKEIARCLGEEILACF